MVQLSHPYVTTGKTIALTIQNFVGNLIQSNICTGLMSQLVMMPMMMMPHYR